jgi:polyhydroxyalkanoate synthase
MSCTEDPERGDQPVVGPQDAGAAGTAVEATNELAASLARLSAMQLELWKRWMARLKPVQESHLEARFFGQLGRLAVARWAEEMRHLSAVPFLLFAPQGSGDARRAAELVRGVVEEYFNDLRALPPWSMVADFAPLAAAFREVYEHGWQGDAARMIDRFLDMMAVKARYGPEYYADPDGGEIGKTPRHVVAEIGRARLYRYEAPAGTARAEAPPVLLVYSVINRPYILDLAPGQSFIAHLLEAGLDVFLIDWGMTEPGDRTTTLDSYLDPAIRTCVRVIRELTAAPRVSLFGHCIGGILAAAYAALFPGEVASLMALTTPITAPEGGVVALFTNPLLFPVDAIVETYGHVPGKLIRYTFMAMKPYYEVSKFKTFLGGIENEASDGFFRVVDRWANENVDIPGETFRSFIKEVYHEDRFRNGKTRLLGRTVDLRAITCPVMNVVARKDWIVPPPSATVLNDLVGSEDRRLVWVEGNHVAIVIDPTVKSVWSEMSGFFLGN